MDEPLASWRPGETRDALLGFLDACSALPADRRLACFDNDGTLWCERPAYVQMAFFLDALAENEQVDPTVRARPALRALLDEDSAALGELGLVRVAEALTGLFAGLAPEEFAARAVDFVARAAHPVLGRPWRETTYQPMLELVDELRARDFTIAVVTGGGTEFVRAVAGGMYGVPPELVVGTRVRHDVVSTETGGTQVVRTGGLDGSPNEGPAKVRHVQDQLGRRPVFVAGNSGGDRELLDWAASGPGPSLALVLDHDDEEREFAYQGSAESFAEAESIVDVARRRGWTLVSMARDWDHVFADRPAGGSGLGR